MILANPGADGRLAVFHGPHRLADYDPAGNPCDDTKLAA
jgi:hypothetical protein